MNCQICHSDNVRRVSGISESDIYECRDCQTQFVYTMCEYHGKYVANNLYNPYYGWFTFERQSEIIRKLAPNILGYDSRILDFGCGGGHFLSHMGSKWIKYGVELSDEARQVASKKHIITCKNFDKSNYSFSFDVITMFATIEHLMNPRETIQQLSKVLKPNGLFVVMTGDVTSKKAINKGDKWHMYKSSEHYWFFSAKGLDLLMVECGFAKVKSLYTDGGMSKIPFLDRFYPLLKGLPLFDHYYAYYNKESK